MTRRRTQITAAELMAKLAKNKEYQEAAAIREAGFEAKARFLGEAEQPIVGDLARAGIEVSSVWDLVNTSEPYPAALPVLLDHLERGGYPDRVMESLGRALAVKPAVQMWERVKALYLKASGPGEEEGLAVVLSAAATPDQADDLEELLQAPRGESRIHFIRPLLRVGGNRGREIVQSLRDNPVFGREAAAALDGRSQRK